MQQVQQQAHLAAIPLLLVPIQAQEVAPLGATLRPQVHQQALVALAITMQMPGVVSSVATSLLLEPNKEQAAVCSEVEPMPLVHPITRQRLDLAVLRSVLPLELTTQTVRVQAVLLFKLSQRRRAQATRPTISKALRLCSPTKTSRSRSVAVAYHFCMNCRC